MCELYVTRFKDTFVPDNIHPEALHAALTNTPEDAIRPMLPVINTSSVTRAIDRLKMPYTAGPESIPAVILKKSTASIALLLVKIFDESLRSCTFLISWKVSWLTPNHKKGCKNEASNYRGITWLGAIAKVLELLVYEQVLASARNYISPNRHGFVPNRSTTTTLMQFVSNCHKSIDARFHPNTKC